METPTTALVKLDQARQALASARTIVDVLDIRDRAATVAYYLKKAGYSKEAQDDAFELRLEAERRAGELLADTVNHNGGNPSIVKGFTRLPEGMTYAQSHRLQAVASVPEESFRRHIATVKDSGGELTTAGVLKLARSLKQQERQEEQTEDGCTVDDLAKLVDVGRTFGTIYADPPWQYGNQATRASTDNHYQTMTVDELAALPVGQLAAQRSHLWLWTTNGFLFECPRLFAAWGFEFKSSYVWCKPQIGIGNYLRNAHEFLLLAVRGGLTAAARDVRSWGEFDRGEHSAKPEAIRVNAVQRLSPGPRLELFGRRAVEGWTVWGNQISRDLFTADMESL